MAKPLRLPRSFVGDKAASLDDFFESTAHALLRGDPSKQESITRLCERIKKELSARMIIDVGGLMKFKRNKMLELLAGIDKDLEHWVEYLEDILDFDFPTPTAVETFRDPTAPPPSAALVPSSAYRVATYKTEKTEKKAGLGAQLQAEGQLDRIIFAYSMFTQLVTQNPKEETITQREVEHINDTVWEMTFQKFGEVHVDIIYRKHCGRNLRLLFPNLPDYGGKKGDDRMFEEMLKWRFNNPRKKQAPGQKMYKPNMKVDRINLCADAIELIEQKNFPLTVLNEGKLETKFHISETETDQENPSETGTRTLAIFGDAPPAANAETRQSTLLPPVVPMSVPLAPVTASTANSLGNLPAAVSNSLHAQEVHGKRVLAETQPKENAPRVKKAKVAPRTEPVYACRTEARHATARSPVTPLTASCALLQVELFKEFKFDVPLKALPFKKIEKNDEVVVLSTYTNDEGVLVPEYWYGIVSLVCANASWIKFYDVTDDTTDKKVKPISEEKHKLKENEYFDTWMRVEKLAPAAAPAGAM